MQQTGESSEAMLQLILKKMHEIELRSMKENMTPREFVRRVCELFAIYEPAGDPTEPLRTLRDLALDYMRSLSRRYHAMSAQEKRELCKLMIYEGGYATRPVAC